jgi:hypothetical protein
MPRFTLAAELKRVVLQLERDLVAQARLRTLSTDADTTVVVRRRDLRTLKARIKRHKK